MDNKQLAGLLREAAAELRLAIHYDYDDPADQPPERLEAAADELERSDLAEKAEPVAVVIDNVVWIYDNKKGWERVVKACNYYLSGRLFMADQTDLE